MPKLLVVILVLAGLVSTNVHAEQAHDNRLQWLLGVWELTDDPDGSPTDWMEFRADGTFVNTLGNCKKS